MPLSEREVSDILDRYETAVRREVAAAINANACGTRFDARKHSEAEGALETARDLAIYDLMGPYH